MCGIAGWSWKNPPARARRRALAAALGVLNDQRGGKGYGVLAVDHTDHRRVWVRKGTETFAYFLGECGLDWALAKVAFLHTRLPSQGAVKEKNSHPFAVGPITGAHNGIVHNHDELNKQYNRDFEVDSVHFFAHLAEGREFKDIRGYGALQWHDARDGKVRVTHFNNGDLAAVRIPKVGVVWSSSKHHLECALKGAGLDWHGNETLVLAEDVVYEVSRGEFYHNGWKVDVGFYGRRRFWQGGYQASSGVTDWDDHLPVGGGCSTGPVAGPYHLPLATPAAPTTPAANAPASNVSAVDQAIAALRERTDGGSGNGTLALKPLHEVTRKDGSRVPLPGMVSPPPADPPPDAHGGPAQARSFDDIIDRHRAEAAVPDVQLQGVDELYDEDDFAPGEPSGFWDDYSNEVTWADLKFHPVVFDGSGNQHNGQKLYDQWYAEFGHQYEDLLEDLDDPWDRDDGPDATDLKTTAGPTGATGEPAPEPDPDPDFVDNMAELDAYRKGQPAPTEGTRAEGVRAEIRNGPPVL